MYGITEKRGELIVAQILSVRNYIARVAWDDDLDACINDVFVACCNSDCDWSECQTGLIKTIAKRLQFHHWRSLKRKRRNLDQLELRAALDSEPEEAACRTERRIQTNRSIERLAPIHRYVIQQRYFRGQSPHEIAQFTRSSVNTVNTRLSRAKTLLRLDQQLAGCV